MKYKGLLIIGIIIILLFGIGYYIVHKSGQPLGGENPCSLKVIKSHIFSLSVAYSDDEADEIAIRILEDKKNRGEC